MLSLYPVDSRDGIFWIYFDECNSFLGSVVLVLNNVALCSHQVVSFVAVETRLLGSFAAPLVDAFSLGFPSDDEKQKRGNPFVDYFAQSLGHACGTSIVIPQHNTGGKNCETHQDHQNQIIISKQGYGIRGGRQRVRRNVQKYRHGQQHGDVQRNPLSCDWRKTEADQNEGDDDGGGDDQIEDVIQHLPLHVNCKRDVRVWIGTAHIVQLVLCHRNIYHLPFTVLDVRGHVGFRLARGHVQELCTVGPRPERILH